LRGLPIDDVYVDDVKLVDTFNEKNEEYFGLNCQLRMPSNKTSSEYHQEKSATWFIPDKYKELNVLEYLLQKVSTQEQIDRINYEYSLYLERKLIDVIVLMIYLVDLFRENNIVWGIGRGSSVSSYILFIIGINRIDPLKYDLDIKEFLK
jgi:DNA polymerase III alpha subunit